MISGVSLLVIIFHRQITTYDVWRFCYAIVRQCACQNYTRVVKIDDKFSRPHWKRMHRNDSWKQWTSYKSKVIKVFGSQRKRIVSKLVVEFCYSVHILPDVCPCATKTVFIILIARERRKIFRHSFWQNRKSCAH